MIVTILAIACIILLGILTIVGYRAIIRGGESQASAEGMEKCTICRHSTRKEELVERLVGDYRILYFCGPCITSLSSDMPGPGNPGNTT